MRILSKKTLFIFGILFLFTQTFAQISNVKTGLWSDKTVWNTNAVPTAIDDVTLNFSITVDIDASCRSLDLNGNNITINAGANLDIVGTGLGVDKLFLSKVYGIYVNESTTDTMQVTTYTYDALKRVTSVINTSDEIDIETLSIFYSYNSTDTLPYKSQLFSRSPEPFISFDTVTTYHYYDNSGQIIKDSMIKAQYFAAFNRYTVTYTIKNYSHVANKIFGSSTSFPLIVPDGGLVARDEMDTATIDVYGNIIDYRKYGYNSTSQSWELDIVSTFTYDRRPSPFARLSNFKTFGVFPKGETFFLEFPQYTNRVTQRETHSISQAGSGYHYNYDYINSYEPNGALKEVKAFDVPPNQGSYGKYILEYKNL